MLWFSPMVREPEQDPVRWQEPVFVVSAGRSGSTHVANILDSHPDVAITHESNIAHYIGLTHSASYLPPLQVRELPGYKMTGLIPELYAPKFAETCLAGLLYAWREFYRQQFAHKPFTRWGDKFQFPEIVPDLVRTFPQARWIHIVRDGRDSARSAVLHHRRERQKDPNLPDMSFREHCAYWARINRLLLDSVRPAERRLLVRYEDVVRHEESAVAGLLEFLELDRHPAVDAFLQGASEKRFASHGTSRDPAASIGRWRTELAAEEQATAHELQGELLAELGYDGA